jgi:hypothetical protein
MGHGNVFEAELISMYPDKTLTLALSRPAEEGWGEGKGAFSQEEVIITPVVASGGPISVFVNKGCL